MRPFPTAIIGFLSFLSVSFCSEAQGITQTIRGIVTDKVLQLPLPGAQVTLPGTTPLAGSVTDENGRFRIEKLPVGRYTIQISYIGYKTVTLANIQVISSKEAFIEVALEEDVSVLEAIEISSSSDKTLPANTDVLGSVQPIRPDEVNRFAGARSDVSRMASNYAGVIGGGDQRNDIIVRGNTPNGILWRLEGADIPAPNHFSVAGNPGGVFSILNNNLLASSDFITGAFPAEYGNRSTAVFDLHMRKGNNEQREHTFQMGLNGFELGTEGPLGKNGGSYLVNGRLFYTAIMDALGADLGASGIPKFMDGSFKIALPTKKPGTAFTIWAIGGKSNLFNKESSEDKDDWDSNPVEDDDFGSNMFATGMSYTHLFDSAKTLGRLAVTYSGYGSTNEQNLVYLDDSSFLTEQFNFTENYLSVMYSIDHKISRKLSWKNGIEHKTIHYSYQMKERDENQQEFEYPLSEKATEAYTSSVYSQFNWKPAAPWQVVGGVYGQYVHFNKTWAIEPRLAASFSIDDARTVRLAYGLHSQTHPLLYYIWQTQDMQGNFERTNLDLDLTRAHHFVAGYNWHFNPNWQIKTELYYQYLFDIPVSSNPDEEYYSFTNLGADFSFEGRGNVVNKGIGYNTGLEVTLERFFNKDYYLLFTGSVFESKYKGAFGTWYNSAFNSNYIFNVLGGKEWSIKGKEQTLSADIRITYGGNKRYVPIDLTRSIEANDEVLDGARAYESRYPDYVRADLKVTYNINRPKVTHQIFVAADNVTNYKNVYYKYFEKGKIETFYQFGVFPYLAYRLNF